MVPGGMAVTVLKRQPLQPLRRAQRRRSILPAYFDLGGKGLFILVVLAASLLALLALAQTGQATAVGYELYKMQQDERNLRWEREALLEQLAKTIDPADLHRFAQERDWRWLRPQEIIFVPRPANGPGGGQPTPVGKP